MASTMKQVVIVGPRQLEVREVPKPELTPERVLVRVRSVGLCTYEQRVYSGVIKEYPNGPGHECAGIVEAVGKNVKARIRPGDKVGLAVRYRCGVCYFCRHGWDNLCDCVEQLPLRGPNGLVEYMTVDPASQVFLLGNNCPLEVGTLAQPLACAVGSLRKAELEPEDVIVVTGAGMMSLLHAFTARVRGARTIITEVHQGRLNRATELGAGHVVRPDQLDEVVFNLTSGLGAAAAFFIGGGADALAQCLRVVRKRGTVVLYGDLYDKPDFLVSTDELHYKELRLVGTLNHTRQDFEEAVALLRGPLREIAPSLITASFPLSRVQDAFEASLDLENYRVVVNL